MLDAGTLFKMFKHYSCVSCADTFEHHTSEVVCWEQQEFETKTICI